jgi:hypothetical protein
MKTYLFHPYIYYIDFSTTKFIIRIVLFQNFSKKKSNQEIEAFRIQSKNRNVTCRIQCKNRNAKDIRNNDE